MNVTSFKTSWNILEVCILYFLFGHSTSYCGFAFGVCSLCWFLFVVAVSCMYRLLSSCARRYWEQCAQDSLRPVFGFLPGACGHRHSLSRGRAGSTILVPGTRRARVWLEILGVGNLPSFRANTAAIFPHCLLLAGAVCSGSCVCHVMASTCLSSPAFLFSLHSPQR